MEEKIIARAQYLEATQMCGNDTPEIGINEETNMVTIGRYNPVTGCSNHIEDVCDAARINVKDLRRLASKAYMYYTI